MNLLNLFAGIAAVAIALSTPLLASGAPKKAKDPSPSPQEITIDSVIAAVDDKPITLSDLNARLAPRKLSKAEIAQDPEATKILEQVISERVMEEEAKVKRLNVGDNEVEDYINEVAQRNGLSLAEFEAALEREGGSMKSYRNQIKTDIIKAKLSSSISRGGVSVTDTEIDEYMTQHPEMKNGGKNIKLHHLIISKRDRSPEELRSRIAQVQEALNKGESFIEVARRLSDASGDASDATLIGIIHLQDMSPTIAEVVSPLRAGQFSAPLETPNDIQIFFVEERLDDPSQESEESAEVDETALRIDETALRIAETALRDEVRQILQKERTKERLATYFKDELFKNHAIERRL